MNHPPNTVYDLGYRFVILGDSNTGKSTLMTKICDGVQSSFSTVGVDFRSTCLNVNGKNCKLHVWDTSGRTEYEDLIISFIKDRDGVVLCFSLADPETFLNLDKWKGLVNEHKSIHTQVLLVGVKSDLVHEVAYEQGEKYAIDNNWGYTEISCDFDSKNAITEKVFVCLADKIYRLFPSLESDLITKPTKTINTIQTVPIPKKSNSYNFDIDYNPYSIPSCSIL
jgi:small GTP-binding protein